MSGSMALSTIVRSIESITGRNKNTDGSVKSSTPQYLDSSESDDGKTAVRLPDVDIRKPLEKDAKDLTTDSESDQQQHSSFNSKSSSFGSIVHDTTSLSLPSSQLIIDVKTSVEASSSGDLQRRGDNGGIKAAKQKFLQEKATKQQEAKATCKLLKPGNQISELSSKSSAPLLNRSSASDSPSSMSSTFLKESASRPVIPPSSQSLSTQGSTPNSNTADHFYNQRFSYGRPNGAFQHPLSRLLGSSSYLPSPRTGQKHGMQNNWTIGEYLYIKVYDLPDSTTVGDLWTAFKREGHIAHIRVYENDKGTRDGHASVMFRPPPTKAFWERGRYSIQLAEGRRISVRVNNDTRPQYNFPGHSRSKYPEIMTMYAESVDFGVMFDQTSMMKMRTAVPTGETGIRFCTNTFHREISVEFPMHIMDPRATSNDPNMQRGKHDRTELFQFRIPFTQLKLVHRIAGQEHKLILLISLDIPPKFFKQLDPSKNHDVKALTWDDSDAWYRQTDLVYVPNGLKKSSLTWRKTNPIIDLGRWTTYRFSFNIPKGGLAQFDQIREALRDYNIEIVQFPKFRLIPRRDASVWKHIDLPATKRSNTGTGLEEMIHANNLQMAFEVRYQLEVCLSQGFLNEHNLSEEFVRTLMNMSVKQARDFLEYIANHGNRIYDPLVLIQAFNGQGLLSRSKIPSYCAYIRSATVTPTTVYFQTPVAETSNRVIRQYSQYADRFLRVRFTEEKTEGKIYQTHKDTMNEVFTRVKRILSNGIRIGDRRYEFLACGNSQFREHGAYFFAPLPNLTTEKIRKWMGMFREIKTVALYASRLGQCFSTTRAIHGARAVMVELPDIRRNGYNFTDGVGKISQFLASLAASELGILQHGQDPPSVFQIRVGGCKGVLAVSPDSIGRQIHIRKSQYKFPAMHEGLEIIRWSQNAFANLNRQLILILSDLGVPDHVFARKLQTHLSKLERAMTDETTALAVLQKEIDPNQMTLTIASMILDDFQKTGEPFLTSLLQLWRAWSIKYLKEKARITIGAGALLLGCVDETATLRGHFNNAPRPSPDASNDEKAKYVPQVFVQISNNSGRKPEVMLGPMLLARNPSLHPGDVRVVCGVDVPQLHHLKDVVVLPQTGDRDVAGMCSGGDLDGDDFLVIWDHDLLPAEWNHEPMDYSRPPMEQPNENIEIDDLTTFFVTYMKNDNLPAIAQAHTANADYLEEGVKGDKCLKLASLHSMAVDYVKTGQPAQMTPDLRPSKWPHFMEKIGKKPHQIYTSKKVLGQLYDQVERIDFVPAFTAPFDARILHSHPLDESILQSAREIKEEYDAHMRRIMAQHEIKTEFEVWSTFVLQHSSTSNDFKYHEQIGEISVALKDQFRLICYERAGGKDYKHMAPFAAAMYAVTAREITAAVEECHCVQMVGGLPRPLREMTASTMPLMSFPWLFQDVLGKIAKSNTFEAHGTSSKRGELVSEAALPQDSIMAPQPRRCRNGPRILDADDYLQTSKGTTLPGEVLELFGESSESCERKEPAEAGYIPFNSVSVKSYSPSIGTSVERGSSANGGLIDHSSSSSPELIARQPREDCPSIAEIPVYNNPKSKSGSLSHLRGSRTPLHSQGKTDVAEVARKEQTAMPNEAISELVIGNDKALNGQPDRSTPEGSNLRLWNDLMIGPSARSEKFEDLTLTSSHGEEKNVVEAMSMGGGKAAKTRQASKNDVSDKVETNEADEMMMQGESKNHDVDSEVGHSSDSDHESDEVVLSIDAKAGLLDQLAAIAGDEPASHASAIDGPSSAVQDSTDSKLDYFTSE